MHATTLTGAFSSPTDVLRSDGTTIQGSAGASVVPYPNPGIGRSFATIGTACGAFLDGASYVRWACYDKAQSRWEDDSNFAFWTDPPRSKTKPGLAYHVLRFNNGTPVYSDGRYGQFYLATTWENDEGRDLTRMNISQAVWSSSGPVNNVIFPPESRGLFANVWAWTDEYAPFVLYEDFDLSALKGWWLADYYSDENVRYHELEFLPFADGTFSAELRTGNDFRVMESTVCLNLRGSRAWCGPGKYGY